MNLLFLKHLRPLIPKQVLTGFSVPAQHRWDLNDSNWGVWCTSDFDISLPEHHPNPYIIHATQTKMSILHILWIWKTLLSPRFGRWWFKLQLVSGSQLNQLNLWFKLLHLRLHLGSQRRCSPPSCATTVPKPSSCRVTEPIKWSHRFFWAIYLSPFTMIASHMTHMTLFGKRLCCYARSAAMVGEDLSASKSEALQSSHVMHLHFHQYHLADQSWTLHFYELKIWHHLKWYWLKRGVLGLFAEMLFFHFLSRLFIPSGG